MQTHRDDDVPSGFLQEMFGKQADDAEKTLLAKLEPKAIDMTEGKENLITAGADGERELFCRRIGRITVRRLPEDPQCTRISVGGAPGLSRTNYLVFRGSSDEVRRLLQDAVDAMADIP